MRASHRVPLLALPIFVFAASVFAATYPAAPKKPVVNEYYGVKVTDDYQWLENGSDPQAKNWVKEENELTRSRLDAFPARAQVFERLKSLENSISNNYRQIIYRGNKLFALKSQPPKQQRLLVTLTSADDLGSEQVVLDPNVLDPSGATAIDFFEPSLDGKLVAVSLSEKGSEDGTVHVYDAASGKALSDTIPRVNYPTAGGSVAWNGDGSGFYYTRYPAPGERPEADIHFFQQVYFHQLGTAPSADRYELGRQFPRIAETELTTSHGGKYILAHVKNGDGGDVAFYLRDGRRWHRIARFEQGVKNAEFGYDDALYLLSRAGAPKGKVLRMPLAKPALGRAQVVITEGEGTIQHIVAAPGKVYVMELVGGPSRVRVLDSASGKIGDVSVPDVSGVDQMVHTRGAEMLLRISTYLEPPAWYGYSGAEVKKTALAVTSAADFSDAEVVRDFAVSKDGTKIPLNIIRRKSTVLDGGNPLILYGYGGYGVSMTPYFDVRRRVWLDQGGVYVVANVRGGGEYGDAWHKAGNLTRKQNVFDDFTAAAQRLIATGYTKPDRLAIEAGSNGGLLMGAVLTQHPALFRAVVSHVGLYDMLRVELDPNGQFNTTEFGTVKNPDQFRALYGYSPYHHVRDGAPYPAVLMLTGDNDGRVNPAHSRKMIARLQAATGADRPIWLRTSASSGHGIGTALDERIAEDTDVACFLFEQLGIAFQQPR